mmetsp:Transcript_148846/g.274896  ORF Transcript_148846/g.274896 Transcript_148846/m.274896 type:complete len:200 (-) Transcript_148846:458-1057(-)
MSTLHRPRKSSSPFLLESSPSSESQTLNSSLLIMTGAVELISSGTGNKKASFHVGLRVSLMYLVRYMKMVSESLVTASTTTYGSLLSKISGLMRSAAARTRPWIIKMRSSPCSTRRLARRVEKTSSNSGSSSPTSISSTTTLLSRRFKYGIGSVTRSARSSTSKTHVGTFRACSFPPSDFDKNPSFFLSTAKWAAVLKC